ncbi:MAG: hypothetical protein EBS29_09735 [Chloroflexia bacterium]|nr:hypothetical protein [Chloroflexia bacterium]
MTSQLFMGAVLYTPACQTRHGWQTIDWAVVRDQCSQLAEIGVRHVVLRPPWAQLQPRPQRIDRNGMANLERCLDIVQAANMQAVVSMLGVTAWGALTLPEWQNSPDVVGWLQGRTTQPIASQGAPVMIDGRWQRLHIANPFTTEAWQQAYHLLIQTVMGYFASHVAIRHWVLAEGWSQLAPVTATDAHAWLHGLTTRARAAAPRAVLAGVVDGKVLLGQHGISLPLLAEYVDVLLVDGAMPVLGQRTAHRLSAPALFLHEVVAGLTQRPVLPWLAPTLMSPTASNWQQIVWQQQLLDIPALSDDDDGRYHETLLTQLQQAGAHGAVLPMPFAMPNGDSDMPIAWLRHVQSLLDTRGHLTGGGTAVQQMLQAQAQVVQRTYPIDSERYYYDPVQTLQRWWQEFG